MQHRGETDGSILFGEPERISVERAVAEFRAGRPVLISDDSQTLLALSVDGIDAIKFRAFVSLCAPQTPNLILTARRARTLGLEVDAPIVLPLANADLATVLRLASDPKLPKPSKTAKATAAACAAIDLAKSALQLPAILAANMSPSVAAIDPPPAKVASRAVARFRRSSHRGLKVVAEAHVPLAHGLKTRFVVFRDAGGSESVAIVVGAPDVTKPVPVRLHSACLTGDVFGSRRCDCGDQLKLALSSLSELGGGVILYLDQEGRGLGLANKMRAYALQDQGLDTVDANTALGFDDDERDYGVAASMLDILGCTRIRLLTNNPAKINGLAGTGIEIVERLPLVAPVNRDNRRYLTAKATRAGHSLNHLLEALDHDDFGSNRSKIMT
ncbi:MAG: GTP cyclohydrolase II [Pseudorhodoplanes sp.]